MIKSLHLSLAFAASLLAGFALPQSASAQWFDTPLPAHEILYVLEDLGFEPIDRPRLRGDIYHVDVIDRRGRRARLAVDAYDGVIVGSVARGGLPPVDIYPEAPPPPLVWVSPRASPWSAVPVVPSSEDRYREPRFRDGAPGGERRDMLAPLPSRRAARAAPEMPDRGPLPPRRPPELALASPQSAPPGEISAARPDRPERSGVPNLDDLSPDERDQLNMTPRQLRSLERGR